MRFDRVLFASFLMVLPSSLFGQPQKLGSLWRSSGGVVFVTECPPGGDHDDTCRAVEVRSGDSVTKLGGGYIVVRLLWSREDGAGGPDVLVLGDYGGSGGISDLFAVTVSPGVSVRKLGGERYDSVAVRRESGRWRVMLPFDIEYFNGAPHSGAIVVPFPVRWSRGDFAVDFREMTRRSYSASEIDVRARAMRRELAAWASDRPPAARLYPPEARSGTLVTVRAMVEMTLSGHADQARDLLDRAWPREPARGDRPLVGEAAFWTALCKAVVQEPSWRRFGLARLAHADVIEQGARGDVRD